MHLTRFDVLFILFACFLFVSTENETAPAYAPPPTGPAAKPIGAIASFVKMIMDIPMGLVEALKDAAEGLEALVVGIMRGIL